MRSGLEALVIASALLLLPAVSRADEAAASSVRAASSAEAGEVVDARTQIEATLAEMRVASLRVRDQLRLTRRRGSKQQVMCVDEALSRADVALRHARALGDAILAAYARGDGEAARAARGQLAELRGLQRFASMQAAKCTPSTTVATSIALASTNTTTVKVDVDPRIPRVD